MFVDSREIAKGSDVFADLCIIGGGAAGITIALEFVDKQFSVVLLESGGFERDDATQALYDGESVGVPYDTLSGCRSRFFGGSTNCGWVCRPLDPLDFEHRSWVAGSGWPFSRTELTPYYHRAQSRLQLGSFDYHPLSWEKRLARRNASFLKLKGSDIENVVDQLSPPTRFGELYRSTLAKATNIQDLAARQCDRTGTRPNGSSVQKVHVSTLSGNTFSVIPRAVVLAAGGIENARLLLVSRRVQSSGLGNNNDLVGRYFMDHPRVRSLSVRLAPNCDRRLYDHSLALVRQRLKIPHIPIAVHFAPTEQKQREMKLNNSRTYLVASAFDYLSASRASIKALLLAIRRNFGKSNCAEAFLAASQIAQRAPRGTLAALDYIFNPQFRSREYWLETVVEPVPQRDSRVTLSSERDQLGINKARLEWRLSDADKQNYLTSVEIVRTELEKQGFILSVDPKRSPVESWPSQLQWCWHHIGTTRMDPDPAKGVVDAQCRVHGLANLFVAGSSVFPTAGSDVPTLTIVALALRLSRQLESIITPARSAIRTSQALAPAVRTDLTL